MHRLLLLAALLLLAPARADDAAIRAELDATFSTISKAVISGDQKTYLSYISPDDKHVYTEHLHWSDELARYKPAEFTLSIGEGTTTLTSTTAEFPLTMSWRFENGLPDNWGMAAKGRTVKFPTVRFTKKDGRWIYQGEKWKEISGGGPDAPFTVRFLEGSEAVAEDVVKAFPVAKAHVDSEFQRLVKEPQTLVIYKSMDHLKATVYLNMPDSYLGGWSEPGESVKFMDSYTRGVSSWTAAYAHEYGHVATWELGPGVKGTPWWVQEGVAELCAGKFRPGYAARLDADTRKRAAAGKLTDWSKISDYMTAEQSLKQIAYTQGDHMMQFVTARWKREGRNEWLKSMAAGKTLDEATREAFKLSFADLDALWRKSLEADHDDKPESKPAAPEPAGIRAALEPMLNDMAAAAAAADQARYLSFISTSDPVFLKEQQNWAKDLSRKAPESVTMQIEPDSIGVGPDGSAVGRLTTTWKMPGGRERTVTFPARFVKSDTRWLYAGEKWNVIKGEGSLVLYENESLKSVAEAVAKVLPEVRAHVDEGFEYGEGAPIKKLVQQVKLYTSMRHLQQSIYLSYTDSLGGWNEPEESIKILSSRGTTEGTLRVLLGHEYGHVATFYLGSKANDMPWWILEGIAELSSAKFAKSSARIDRMVKGWAKTDKLVAWDKLADFHGEALNHQLNVYNQGHHMVAFIESTYTRHKLNAWMAAQAGGSTMDKATHDVLGLSFDELDAKWRASLVVEEPKKPDEPKKTEEEPKKPE